MGRKKRKEKNPFRTHLLLQPPRRRSRGTGKRPRPRRKAAGVRTLPAIAAGLGFRGGCGLGFWRRYGIGAFDRVENRTESGCQMAKKRRRGSLDDEKSRTGEKVVLRRVTFADSPSFSFLNRGVLEGPRSFHSWQWHDRKSESKWKLQTGLDKLHKGPIDEKLKTRSGPAPPPPHR